MDSHGITTWQEYKAVSRKGRGVPLSAKKRQLVWAVMELIRQELLRQGLSTFNLLCAQAASLLRDAGARSSPAELALGAASHPWQHVVVDECQDFGPAELGLLRALAEPGADDLFFCGDEGQRIYKPRVSWLTLGIDVRGRSHHLTLNYRTTEQIRRRADALLPGMVTDGDGAQESQETRSLLSGPMPQFLGLPTRDAERGRRQLAPSAACRGARAPRDRPIRA